jgi:hypothetical protein
VKKFLFWSVAATGDGEAARTGDADQSHVPPVLRGLRKCEACGFPVSAGRVLCVECEEKKWRGQLRSHVSDRKPLTGVAAVAAPASSGGSFAATAVSMARSAGQIQGSADAGSTVAVIPSRPDLEAKESAQTVIPGVAEGSRISAEIPELVLSAGLEPQRSWFSANKYVLLALLAIGTSVAAFLALR